MQTMAALRVGLRRATARTASVVAPGVVEKFLIKQFSTPRRRSADTGAVRGEQWTIRSGDDDVVVYSHGSGPRVLFVHGWEGSAADFAAMSDAFSEAGFGTVTFDQPAHGRSTGARTTLPRMSRAVLDVARATGPFAAVVGHSLGASAALLAMRDGLPARCAVLMAPPYDAHPFVAALGEYIGVTRARIAGAIDRIERSVGAVGGRATDRAALLVRAPGLVLHDRADRHVPFAHGVSVAAAWPGARFVPLDGLGHRRMLDAPAVHQECLAFIQNALASGSRGAGTTFAPSLVPAQEISQ